MKAAGVKDLKDELKSKTKDELVALALRLSRFKKENKELLTYLLFEASNEDQYVSEVKTEINKSFEEINTGSIYFVKKNIRKILRETKKHIRYSNEKKTEVELLLHYCQELKKVKGFNRSSTLQNIVDTQVRIAKKALEKLHEDLQYDYEGVLAQF